MTGTEHKERRHPSVFTLAAVLLAGFLTIFVGLNLYKYLTLKRQYSSQVLSRLNKSELDKVKGVLGQIANQLLIVRDIAKNSPIQRQSTVELNKRFMPFLENLKMLSGLFISDDKGWEYFLYRKDGYWTTRIIKDGGSSLALFQQWSSPEKAIRKWEEDVEADLAEKGRWLSRLRPDGEVEWSPIYRLFESGEPGVSALISWKEPKAGKARMFLGVDIPVDGIRELLILKDSEIPGILFLVNPRDLQFIAGRKIQDTKRSSAQRLDLDSVIRQVIDKWQDSGRPNNAIISVKAGGEKWISKLQPVIELDSNYENDLWIGIIATESVIVADLKDALLRFDPQDMAVALAGGAMLLLLFWKAGGFRRIAERGHKDPALRLYGYINRGEGTQVEFKSTIRTNLKSGKHGKEIELAWLKAVAGFLNSSGGALLLGVDDSGRIIGVDQDGFENDDRLLLHIKNLINQHIGAEFTSFINVELISVDSHRVVMIECRPAREPVFLKIGKNEEFYIRSGPSSVKLTPSQTVSYVLQDMKRGK